MTKINDINGEGLGVNVTDGNVRLVSDDRWLHAEYAPARARELAAALLRAADEAEGRTVADMTDEERNTRARVAAELEELPRYNDVADWCAHVGYRAAVNTARYGSRA